MDTAAKQASEQERIEQLHQQQLFALQHTGAGATAGNSNDTDSKHACLACGKEYGRKSDLLVHLRAHTGEKPFVCNKCGKSFTKKSHLTRHRKIHTGEKPFSCGFCGKLHARMSDLKVHLRTHTGERPYACSICGKTFITSSHVRMHERTHDESTRAAGVGARAPLLGPALRRARP